jgi:hypoxanthine phosphoribosyltransferase
MDKNKVEDFCGYAFKKVYFYIESSFWSKLDIPILRSWLSNFKTMEEKYCAAKLLDRFVYYSEEDIISLIKYGLYELVLKRKILEHEVNNSFLVSNQELVEMQNNFFSTTLILPLLKDNLSESSLAILRHLTNDLGFPEENILNNHRLDSKILSKAKNLLIVDDFIGTGNQILQFWNQIKITIDDEDVIVNKLKTKFPNLDIEYFCLVCTEEGYSNFHAENNYVPLKITYCEMLSNKFKVFGKDSVYFTNDEVEDCRLILEDLCKKNDVELLGYNSLDYAIAFHHSIPDSSLPLFYKQTSTWKPLFKNKKTIINVV